MNSYTKYVLIAISVLATAIAVPVFASEYDEEACPDCSFDIYENDRSARLNEVPIRAWADKNLYDHESKIVIQGIVYHIKEEIPVTVRVISPQGNIVGIQQVHVEDDRMFETSFSTSGTLFKENGVYTIRVQYGPQEINDKIEVEILGTSEEMRVSCSSDEITVESDSDTYCLPFSADSVDVRSATVSSELSSITMMVSADTDGLVTLVLPREVIDSTSDDGDSDFIVLVDGEEADFEEVETDDSARTLEIMVPEGSTQIEIIGTFAVPEFGAMAAIILAVAIVSIIAVSAKSRLVLSKY